MDSSQCHDSQLFNAITSQAGRSSVSRRQNEWACRAQSVCFLSHDSQGRLPEEWKIAKIIPLRKPDQTSYILTGAYRPISLLSTLEKAMASAIATRIGYLAKKHLLLPGKHFGSLKGRSTVDALLALQEKVYQAWRDKRLLLLVTFDVKGAVNGVAPTVLVNRLRECHIPEELVCWTEDFTQNRKASVVVNRVTTSVSSFPQAGLVTSMFSAIIHLYLFLNSDLVRSVINKNKGAIAFIDDYTAWVTSTSIAENLAILQPKIIPHLESWALSSFFLK